jgi:hypothetical protein
MENDVSSCFPFPARILIGLAWLWFAFAVV